MRVVLMVFATVVSFAAFAGPWTYDQRADPMGRGTIKTATTESRNQITFRFPYHGAQRAELELRLHPQYGKDVILSFRKAHFLCHPDECSVLVRFDDAKAERYSAAGPADHSTTHIFIRGYDRFVARLRSAKVVRIEAQFYQDANRVLEFDVAGLEWGGRPAAKAGTAAKSTTAPPRALSPGDILARAKGCLACHDIGRTVVGPAFRDVAARYGDAPAAAAKLAQTIKVGGSGKWKSIPMPPTPGLSDADALTLATWVLTFK